MFASASGVSPASAPTWSIRVNPEFAQAVADGLSGSGQKTLPPAWFYDEVGSALFEVITVLPEYGLTRAETKLLLSAADDIVRASGYPPVVIELGSGTGTKTRHILSQAVHYRPVRYFPIDISPAALDSCVKFLQNVERLTVEPIEDTYLAGIDMALAARKPGEPALLLFLGSTIGNFSRPEAAAFLACVCKRMQPGDHLLLGADLVKPRAKLISAYDDPIGVTAAFNLNLLSRINRELDGRFELSQFAHEARYDEAHSRIEMHLRSLVEQEVPIGELGLTVPFLKGETIWTESSHKFQPEEISRTGLDSGWRCVRQWIDREWSFAETLFRKPRT